MTNELRKQIATTITNWMTHPYRCNSYMSGSIDGIEYSINMSNYNNYHLAITKDDFKNNRFKSLSTKAVENMIDRNIELHRLKQQKQIASMFEGICK